MGLNGADEVQKATIRRTKKVDMSPEAIDQRLRDLSQLFKLGMSIREAKYLGAVEQLAPEKPSADSQSQRNAR